MKKIVLLLMTVLVQCSLSFVQAQSPPPVEDTAKFVWFVPFSADLSTDPNWHSPSDYLTGGHYRPASNNANSKTNSDGPCSILLGPLTTSGDRCELYYLNVPTSPTTNGYTLCFWYTGQFGPNDTLSISLGNQALFPSIRTNALNWTEVDYTFSPPTNQNYSTLIFLLNKGSGGNFCQAGIDAVQWSTNTPAATMNTTSDFTITDIGNGNEQLCWQLSVYPSYSLIQAQTITGPWTQTSAQVTTNGGTASVIVPNQGGTVFFRLQK